MISVGFPFEEFIAGITKKFTNTKRLPFSEFRNLKFRNGVFFEDVR